MKGTTQMTTTTTTRQDPQPREPRTRRGWIRRHIPVVTPRLWLCSVTGSPLAEAMAR
jgi:hypothetical protein